MAAFHLAGCIIFVKVIGCASLQLDFLSCGIDSNPQVDEGLVAFNKYPWLGILYYTFDDAVKERATTTAILIRKQYAMVSASDVSHIPRDRLKTHTRVVFGQNWNNPAVGQLVDKLSIHPEFRVRTLSTLAIVELDAHTEIPILPVCPPIKDGKVEDRTLYNIIMHDMKKMQKDVRLMAPIDKHRCTAYYVRNKLWYPLIQPTHPICATSVYENGACVWEGGSALVTRDFWGRWRLVGFGVRGPGCGAPSQYINVYRYLNWIEKTISSNEHITMYRISQNHIMLRQGGGTMDELDEDELDWLTPEERIARNTSTFREFTQMGNCFDTTVESEDIFKEDSLIECTALSAVKGRYRMMITQIVNVMCVTVRTIHVHGASPPFLWIEHACDREISLCHIYRNTTSFIDLAFLFSFNMRLQVVFTGIQIKGEEKDEEVQLLPPEGARQEWKEHQIEYFDYAREQREPIGVASNGTMQK